MKDEQPVPPPELEAALIGGGFLLRVTASLARPLPMWRKQQFQEEAHRPVRFEFSANFGRLCPLSIGIVIRVVLAGGAGGAPGGL
jgi:hypothetical protein